MQMKMVDSCICIELDCNALAYRDIGLLDFAAAAAQHLRDVFLALANGTPQWRHAPPIDWRDGNIERQQKGHHIQLAEGHRDMKRRPKVIVRDVQAAVMRVNATDFLGVS
jgi:hypothetical protein